MRASQFLITTLRDTPGDAVISSHRLMLRAGIVGKLGSGLYHLLPMGLRVFRKIENIIRDEMNNAGALEFILPVLIPAELWKKSGRWDVMGKEMFRVQDRHEVWNVLGPTHEESFTDLMKGILKSYRDLPVNVYQIHTKFRDEIRPRFGVIRSREFVMKDAYSFHRDEQSLSETYAKMRVAYRNIFNRSGLETIPVEADTGAMGGSKSEEFMVPSEVGEETLLVSEGGKYHSNQEKTPLVLAEGGPVPENVKKKQVHATPGAKSIADVSALLNAAPEFFAKAMLYKCADEFAIVFIRGDRQINEVKLKNAFGGLEVLPANDAEVQGLGLNPGFLGPQKLPEKIRVIKDKSIQTNRAYVVGGPGVDQHESGFVFGTDISGADFEERDMALVVGGDISPEQDGKLKEIKGIEVGHIFQLGDKYTKAFEVSVLDETGRPLVPLMGCYGIGLQRTIAAIVEQNHDEKGIVWPEGVAPFQVVIVSITKTEEEIARVNDLYLKVKNAGIEVIWDDRDLRPGVRFADAELIGYPLRITCGKIFFESGKVEIQIRKTAEQTQSTEKDLLPTLSKLLGIQMSASEEKASERVTEEKPAAKKSPAEKSSVKAKTPGKKK